MVSPDWGSCLTEAKLLVGSVPRLRLRSFEEPGGHESFTFDLDLAAGLKDVAGL